MVECGQIGISNPRAARKLCAETNRWNMASQGGRRIQSRNTDRVRPAYIQQKELIRARQAAAWQELNIQPNQFQCEVCQNIFEKAATDEEVKNEAKERYPGDDLSDAVLVCVTCRDAILKAVGGDVP